MADYPGEKWRGYKPSCYFLEQMVELYHCESLDMRSMRDMLMENNTVVCLRIGRVSQENLYLDEACCPSLQVRFQASRLKAERLLHESSCRGC